MPTARPEGPAVTAGASRIWPSTPQRHTGTKNALPERHRVSHWCQKLALRVAGKAKFLARDQHESVCGVIEMLWTYVSRGKNKGVRLTPHRFVRDNGRFHLAESKKSPHIAVTTEAEIVAQLRLGLRLRMSNRAEGYPPSLICPRSIKGWE